MMEHASGKGLHPAASHPVFQAGPAVSPESPKDQTSLDAKFASGLAWTVGAKWATQILTWATTIGVARLLIPAEAGVADIAGMYLGITNVLAEFGIGTAVLHMPELQRKALGQLHLFSMMVCTAMFGLSALAAPLLAVFFGSKHVGFFVANNIAFLFTGIQAVPYGLLQRDMDYRRLSILDAIMAVVRAIVTLLGALAGWSFWSFWAGGTASLTVGTILMCYWKPIPFAWVRWADIRRPIEMGRHVAVSRVTSVACSFADSIIVGRMLGVSALGTYRMAMNLASAPAEKVSSLIMRTASPLFANVMDDTPLVRRYYLIIAELMSLVVTPLMLGLVILAPLAVATLFDAQWFGVTGPLRWLGLFMIVRVLGVLAEQVLVSQRLTQFTMRFAIFNFLIMVVAFVVGAKLKGSSGVAAAWVVLSPLTIMPLLIMLTRKIHLPLMDYVRSLLPAVSGSAVMCLALMLLGRQHFLTALPLQVRLGVQVVVGGIVYVAMIFCFFRERVRRYLNFLSMLKKREADCDARLIDRSIHDRDSPVHGGIRARRRDASVRSDAGANTSARRRVAEVLLRRAAA